MALLLPALGRARKQANIVACASNMRQIGIAMFLYANENQGTLPWAGWNSTSMLSTDPHPASYLTGVSSFAISWDDLISPQLGQPFSFIDLVDGYYGAHSTGIAGAATKVLKCPADQASPSSAFPHGFVRSYSMPGGGFSIPAPASSSYAAQETFGVGWWQDYSPSLVAFYTPLNMPANQQPYGRKLSRIRDSSGTLLLVEQPLFNGSNVVGNTNAWVRYPYKQLEYASDPTVAAGAAVHGGLRFHVEAGLPYAYANLNYLYCDGHVSFTDGLSTVGTGSLTIPRGAWTSDPGD